LLPADVDGTLVTPDKELTGWAIAFLAWLHGRGRTPTACRQADVDAWYAGRLPCSGGERRMLRLAASLAVAFLTGPAPLMLCGTRLRHTWPGAPGQPVSEFPDENLCRACVRALGDQSVRPGIRAPAVLPERLGPKIIPVAAFGLTLAGPPIRDS